MYESKNRKTCAAMLLVSLSLRLCMLFGLDTKAAELVSELAKQKELTQVLLFLETGQRKQVEEPEPEVRPVVLYQMDPVPKPQRLQAARVEAPPAEAEPLPEPEPEEPPVYLPTACVENAAELKVAGECTYQYDRQALLDAPSTLDVSGEGPKVLVIHTHGTEAYEMEPGLEYTPSAPYRTLEENRSVIAVGEVLTQCLEEAGIETIHDTTIHDYPDYNRSYRNMLQTLEQRLAENPGIQVVLDVHRDGVEDQNGNALALCCTQGAQRVAQVMLVVGTDQGGLEHPNWQENLANGFKLQAVLDGMYPGFCRKLNLRKERFNQHVRPGSILVEVGSNGNTLTEAKAAAELLADGLIRMLGALEQTGGTLVTEKEP